MVEKFISDPKIIALQPRYDEGLYILAYSYITGPYIPRGIRLPYVFHPPKYTFYITPSIPIYSMDLRRHTLAPAASTLSYVFVMYGVLNFVWQAPILSHVGHHIIPQYPL